MREILSYFAAPVIALITYILGHMAGRKKTSVEIERIELENLNKVVKFYKDTFEDLKAQLDSVSDKCKHLYEEIKLLRAENISLKQEIHLLNDKLKNYTTKQV